MNKVRKALLVLLACWATFSHAQGGADTLSGVVLDGSTSKPLPNASILIRSKNDQTIVQFSIANEHGKFSFPLTRRDIYYMEINYLGFERQIVDLPSTASGDFIIAMVPADYALQEVVVSDKASIRQMNDTLRYNAAAYSDSTETYVYELLKKMPGIDVNDRGDITVYGKEIQTLLLDGEDLSNRNYQVLSKNLRSDLVKEVEILFNYHSNPILKELFQSDQVSINLVLKDEKKQNINGSATAGIGSDSRYVLDGSLVSFFRKTKSLSFLQASSTGKPMQYLRSFDPPTDGLEGAFLWRPTVEQLGNLAVSYQENDITRFNRTSLISNRISFPIGTKFKVQLSGDLPKEELTNHYANHYLFSNQNIPDYTDSIVHRGAHRQSHWIFNATGSLSSTSRIQAFISKGNFHSNRQYQFLRRESNEDGSTNNGLLAYLSYTKKWSSIAASVMNVQFTRSDQDNILSFQFFTPVTSEVLNTALTAFPQSRTLRSDIWRFEKHLLLKRRENVFKLSFSLLSKKHEFSQEQSRMSNNSGFFREITQNEASLTANYNFDLFRGKGVIFLQQGLIGLNTPFFSLNAEEASVKRRPYSSLGLEYAKDISKTDKLQFRYSFQPQAPELPQYLNRSTFTGRYNIETGLNRFFLNQGHNVQFNFSKQNAYPFSLIYTNWSLRLNKLNETGSFVFDNNFVFGERLFLAQNTVQANIEVAAEKFLEFISSTIKIKPYYFHNQYANFFEGKFRQNYVHNVRLQASLKSGWDFPINITIGSEMDMSQVVARQSPLTQTFTASNLLAYGDVYFRLSNSLICNLKIHCIKYEMRGQAYPGMSFPT